MEKNEFVKLMSFKRIKRIGNQKAIDLFTNSQLVVTYERSNYEISKMFDYCKSKKIHIISYFDLEYPDKLKKINSPPLILFARGNLCLLKKKLITIVGSRGASEKTKIWAYNISKELSDLGYVIVSGGAQGIDTYAHRGALNSSGETICVLGSGIDNVYPEENIPLIENISRRGLVISEVPPTESVSRINLLQRNRITSALGDKVLIVSIGRKGGGSKSQFRDAYSQGKEIFAPDPSLELKPNEGLINLIKENKIIPIQSVEDMFNFQIKKEEKGLKRFL